MTGLVSAPQSTGAELRLEKLRKTYSHAEQPAVRDIDLTVAAGEFVTLLGPSGSGKTTTLNMIAGFVPITSGRVLLDGIDIATLPPYRRNLGFVFQSYALFPHMTVEENIAYPLHRRKLARAEITRRCGEVMDLVQLRALARRRPSELSGGQQQRVALARAVVFQPRALLLDEPLAALDRQLRESLQDELRRLHRELGITVLLVTHDQQEALHLSDRVAVFENGELQQVASPQDLYERPETLFVAQFFGESRVLQGTVRDGGIDLGGGLSVPAEGAQDVPNGTPMGVVIRPEVVRISEPRPGAFLAGRGTITDIVYRGATVRVTIALASGHELLAVVQPRADLLPRLGDEIPVSWDPRETAIVPASPIPAGHIHQLESETP